MEPGQYCSLHSAPPSQNNLPTVSPQQFITGVQNGRKNKKKKEIRCPHSHLVINRKCSPAVALVLRSLGSACSSLWSVFVLIWPTADQRKRRSVADLSGGGAQAGPSIHEVMPASVNLSCQNVLARQKLRRRKVKQRTRRQRRGNRWRGCLTESMRKGSEGRKLWPGQ